MQVDLLDELQNLIPFQDAYNEEVVEGYNPNQLQNLRMKLMMEEEVEWMLANDR
jgi:hypothetical protein